MSFGGALSCVLRFWSFCCSQGIWRTVRNLRTTECDTCGNYFSTLSKIIDSINYQAKNRPQCMQAYQISIYHWMPLPASLCFSRLLFWSQSEMCAEISIIRWNLDASICDCFCISVSIFIATSAVQICQKVRWIICVLHLKSKFKNWSSLAKKFCR